MVTFQQRQVKWSDLASQKKSVTVTGVATTGTAALITMDSFNSIDVVISLKITAVTPVGNATVVQAGTPVNNQIGMTLVGASAGTTLTIEAIAMGS